MDIQKVIEELKNDAIATDTGYVHVPSWIFNRVLCLLGAQHEAINKLKKGVRSYPWYEDIDKVTVCPGCYERIDDICVDPGVLGNSKSFNPEYCPYCGKHIDWSKTVSYGTEEEHE